MTTLKSRAEEIRDKTTPGANTANRVGGLFVDIVDGVPVQYGAKIEDTANLVRNDRVLKTSLFEHANDKDLTLLKADWEEGDWMVIRQFGDGQATIVPEDANVKLPDKDSTPGKGQDIFIECYDIDGDDKYFHITNGVEIPE